jgi:intracellular sulfur oxidation DsrE/DsrF family protein
VNSGFGLAWSRVFYLTNNETGVPDSDISVMAVLRHGAVALALVDQAWAKYKLGEVFKINDPKTNAPAVRNIFYNTAEGELPLPGMDIRDLLQTGVLFGACNMAIKFYSGMLAKNTGGNADTIASEWRTALIPGIQLVPSGVWAVNRAQERACSYCFAG